MKYRPKSTIIEAEQYHLGLEDGWRVYFSGNFGMYDKIFDNRWDADKFIKNNDGIHNVENDDKKYPIIYENPVPVISLSKGYVDIGEHDYIEFKDDKKYLHEQKQFEELYEKVEV